MVGTNLKASLFLQFPIEKEVIRIGAPKKKKKRVCIVYNFKSFCQWERLWSGPLLSQLFKDESHERIQALQCSSPRVERRKSMMLFSYFKILSAFPGT